MRFIKTLSRPSTTVVVTAALAALVAASGTAFAARLITGSQIANSTIESRHLKNSTVTGADIAPNAIDSSDIKPGSVTVNDLTKGANTALDGKDGKDGANGAQGPKGDTGASGAKGDKGATGDAGAKGDKGDDGADAPAEEFGVASVWVNRKVDLDGAGAGTVFGYVAASRWAQYSTTLGAPVAVGDSTGGEFRFTCNSNQAPCKVSLKADVLSSTSTANAKVYARLLLTRYTDASGTDLGNDKVAYCEYGDGADNAGGKSTIGRDALDADPGTAGDTLTMGIGGSLDCGTTGQVFTPTVTEIHVPVGYYEAAAGFQFYTA